MGLALVKLSVTRCSKPHDSPFTTYIFSLLLSCLSYYFSCFFVLCVNVLLRVLGSVHVYANWMRFGSHDMWIKPAFYGAGTHMCGAVAVQIHYKFKKSPACFLCTVVPLRCKFQANAFYRNTSESHIGSVLNTDSNPKKKSGWGPYQPFWVWYAYLKN